MTDKFDAFVSHAAADTALVKQTLAELHKLVPQLRIWVDFERIQPGDDWANKIVSAASGTELFLIFGTKAAFASNWVHKEIGIGLSRRLFEKIPILILAFDPDSIPNDLKRYQYIDFQSQMEGVRQLANFLSEQFSSKRQKPTMAFDAMPNFETRGGDNNNHCSSVLNSLRRAELRRRISQKLNRKQVAVLWYDVLENRMDDEVPEQAIANCVLELILRSESSDRMSLLIESICHDHPYVGYTD